MKRSRLALNTFTLAARRLAPTSRALDAGSGVGLAGKTPGGTWQTLNGIWRVPSQRRDLAIEPKWAERAVLTLQARNAQTVVSDVLCFARKAPGAVGLPNASFQVVGARITGGGSWAAAVRVVRAVIAGS